MSGICFKYNQQPWLQGQRENMAEHHSGGSVDRAGAPFPLRYRGKSYRVKPESSGSQVSQENTTVHLDSRDLGSLCRFICPSTPYYLDLHIICIILHTSADSSIENLELAFVPTEPIHTPWHRGF